MLLKNSIRAEGVVTNLLEVSLSVLTSQGADVHHCAFKQFLREEPTKHVKDGLVTHTLKQWESEFWLMVPLYICFFNDLIELSPCP